MRVEDGAELILATVNDPAGSKEVSIAFDTAGNMNVDIDGKKDEAVLGTVGRTVFSRCDGRHGYIRAGVSGSSMPAA